MSLNKAIAHGKEKRAPYRGGKAVAYSCRNHDDCSFCSGNRLYQENKEMAKAKSKLSEQGQLIG